MVLNRRRLVKDDRLFLAGVYVWDPIGKGPMPTNNRASTVFRMAAFSLRESDSNLGAQFR
jgi:hypothetical protein